MERYTEKEKRQNNWKGSIEIWKRINLKNQEEKKMIERIEKT